MKTKVAVILLTCLITYASAQTDLPEITANSLIVSIKDKGVLQDSVWSIAPEYNPDVYLTDNLGGEVIFYTDNDSIKINISEDTSFDFVINLRDSVKAITRVAYAPSFLDVLKTSRNSYSSDINSEIPEFTYLEKNDSNLKALRETYNLDSIAGGGNESSKIINLLHWVHRTIKHDGNVENPRDKNALNLLAVCSNNRHGLNCRGLATVLNECYLAVGIESRFVTCLPKDPNDTECHVINMVYNKELEKWIWIDPTHGAYVTDENGILLSIQEVRSRLINDEKLILNPDANWNFQFSTIKEDYLDKYMAKNLYKFESPLHSNFDLETPMENKENEYVRLFPVDDENENLNSTRHTTSAGVVNIIYKTTNPEQFWASPKRK